LGGEAARLVRELVEGRGRGPRSRGIAGFLENRQELYRRADLETEEWRAFTSAWWAQKGGQATPVGELLSLAQDLLPSLSAGRSADAGDRALKIRLGTALHRRRDRRFGGFLIRHAGEERHTKRTLWRLERVSSAVPEGEGAGCFGAEGQHSANIPQGSGRFSDSIAGSAECAESFSGFVDQEPEL
jgi:hypothetical protein